MNLKDFTILKKTMERTFSENDHEALSSIRAANRILAQQVPPLTWAQVFARTVTVIDEVEEAPETVSGDEGLIIEAKRAALNQSRKAQDFVDNVAEHFANTGWLSRKQRVALEEVRDR